MSTMKGASEEPVTTTRTFMFGSVTGNAAIVAAGIHLCALVGLAGVSAYFWPFKCTWLVSGGLWVVSSTFVLTKLYLLKAETRSVLEKKKE